MPWPADLSRAAQSLGMAIKQMYGHGFKLAVGVLLVGLLMKYGVPAVAGPMPLEDALITVGVIGLVVGAIKHSAMMKK